MRRLLLQTALLGLALVLAGCGADLSGIRCHSDYNCPSGFVCSPSTHVCVGTPADAGVPDHPVVCNAPYTRCPDGNCVNLNNDPSNCGACGNLCGKGAVCQAKACVCPSYGETLCDGNCVDTLTDPNNCGACGVTCAMGATCNDGSCRSGCGSMQINCYGTCVDTQTDPMNCGGCGNVCPTGDTCSGGLCGGMSCGPFPYMLCGGACVDTSSDNSNCGACGNACPTSTTCVSGSCVGTPGCGPTPSYMFCGGTCTDTATDPSNCGACGNACAGGEACSSGICHDPIPACPLFSVQCTSSSGATFCTDTSLDSNNCGSCGSSCATVGYCYNGSCTTGLCASLSGAHECRDKFQDDCTSGTFNPIDCGACGHECSMGQACLKGSCYDFLPVSDCGHCGGAFPTCCSSTGDPTSPTICIPPGAPCP